MNYEVKTLEIDRTNIVALKELFKKCEWNWLESDEQMLLAFQGSFLVLAGYSDQSLVSFGRIISDGFIYGLMVDVMVSPEYRKRGYGKVLINQLIHESKLKGLRVIQLLASSQGKELYLGIGFKTCPEASPGMVNFLLP